MTLPDIKFNADFTEKPLAGKQRASDDAVMLDVNSTIDTLDELTKIDAETGELELRVVNEGHVCAANTSIIPLGIGGVFTGGWQDTLDYGTVTIGINADQNSALNGLDIQWSADGITIHDHDYFTITANVGKVFTFGPARRYVRLKYTNGAVAQTTFYLETSLRSNYVKPSSHRITDAIVAEDDAQLTKSVLTGLTPSGVFKNVNVTNAGNMKASIEELENSVSVNGNTQLRVTPFSSAGVESVFTKYDYGVEIAKGNISGHSLVHKFGRNDNVPNGSWVFVSLTGMTGFGISSAVAVRVRAGGNAADTDTTGAGARKIVVQGIAADGTEQTETINLAGALVSSPTTILWWRVHRAWVSEVGTYGGANTAEIIVETTGGVAVITIAAGEGQTQKAVYTIPVGKTGYLLSVHSTVSSLKEANIRCFTRADITDVTAPMASKRLKLFWDGISGSFVYKPYTPELVIPALSDIWFEAYGDGAVSQVSVDFEILLVDN